MMRTVTVRRSGRYIALMAGLTLLLPTLLTAQPIATLRWQTQPFCNVLTLAISLTGAGYRLEGTDDQCGAPTKASVIGMAFPNADGSIGVGLTIVSPGAAVLHLDAMILLTAGFNGTWHDTVGRSGTWLFTPGAGAGGPLRPVVGPVSYGSVLAQPNGGSDRGLSVTVAADTAPPNDAAGGYGRFGAPLPPGLEGPAGVRGESDADAGVYGRTTSGIGVVGGAHTGIGVQGHGVTVGSTGVQAHHVAGGTALEINNGGLKVAGAVRAAFEHVEPHPVTCSLIDHPLTNGDFDALLFVTTRSQQIATYVQFFSWAQKVGHMQCLRRDDRWGRVQRARDQTIARWLATSAH